MQGYIKCLSCDTFYNGRVAERITEYKSRQNAQSYGCSNQACRGSRWGNFKQATPDKLTDNILFRLKTGDVRWI